MKYNVNVVVANILHTCYKFVHLYTREGSDFVSKRIEQSGSATIENQLMATLGQLHDEKLSKARKGDQATCSAVPKNSQ